MTEALECRPVGIIATPFASRAEAPRQGHCGDAEGVLTVEAEFAAGLDGVEVGNDLLVLWLADRADRSVLRVDRGGGRGVFASRSPDRPCPVGLTRCRVAAVDGRRLTLRGVDMLDGTPVLDLKPPLRE